MEKTKDEAFKDFLEKIQGQNKAGLLLSTLQLKYERETAGEDADKREEQLEQVATALENVEKAITGMSVKFDFEPIVNALENQTQVLQKSLEEQALLRKVSEGSLEYDKESAQYRNVSGKELTSNVSGKTIKQGGYVDFETAANRLQGQGKRVRESEQNQITFKPVELGKKTTVTDKPGDVTPKREKDEETTGFGNIGDLGKAVGARLKGIYDFMTNKVDKKEDVEAKPEVTGINQESDNIQSTQEIMADSAKKDVELTGINNDLLEQQLKELKKISAALAPSSPSELPEGRLKAGRTGHEVAGGDGDGGGGGLGLGDALSGMGGLAKKAGGAILKGAKVVGKGALSVGGGVAKFAASGAGKLLGATAAVGLGAYTAYKGYTAAEDSKQAKLEEVQAKVDSGEIKPEEAATARKEIGNTATVEKSGAVGEGTGMAGGAIAGGMAGAKLGAAIGSIIPGAGTVIGAGIGTIAGGALGAFAGSKAGKYVGEKVGSGINAVKGFFGGKTDTPGAATKEALAPTPATVPVGGQPVAAIASMKNSGKAEKLSGIKKEFQESEAREAASREKIKEFEKANPFDVKPKGDIESGITPGKFNDPKKQAEYDKLKKEEETLGLQSIKLGSKYKEADVGKDVKPMSAAQAAQLNKQAEEANAAGRHPTGQPHKTDYKEGDEAGLSESDKRKKYTAALLEKGVAAKDIDPFRAKDQYSEQIQKELRSEKVTGGPGAKNSVVAGVAAGAAAIPIIEKKPVDTAAPGKAVAVAPTETIDGKKVKPVTDVEKVQQVAKEKYQASTSEEKAASEKLKAFEKENQFDYREKPTVMQDFLEEPGTGKFKDPKKQEEYDKLKGAKQQASESKRSAGAEYTAAEGVTKTYEFTGGVQPSKPGAKGGIQGKIDSEIGGMQSDGAKIEALKKRGYTDKDLGRDDTLKQNYIGMSDGAKYPNRNLGVYENIVKKELEAPIKAKTKDGQVIPEAGSVVQGVAASALGAKSTGRTTGSEVTRASTENTDLTRETNMRQSAVQPIISSNVSNNNTQSFVPIKPSPRSERSGSALDRYNDRVSAY